MTDNRKREIEEFFDREDVKQGIGRFTLACFTAGFFSGCFWVLGILGLISVFRG